jgi:3-oxoacyl-[acyl-carrier protein] reductase
MKKVLITGGSRGIGRSMVELFSNEGYKVAFTYLTSEADALELSEKTGALAIRADQRSSADIKRACDVVRAKIGAPDVLINNASVCLYGLLTDVEENQWDDVFDTCVKGAYLYSKCILPEMINKKWGRIINISSMWGKVGASCEVAYSAAKAALDGFTKALAKEVAPSGVTVNSIAPGVVMTDMLSSFSHEEIKALEEQTPVGRLGVVEDISRAALFLASDESSYITGDIMNISGGFVV